MIFGVVLVDVSRKFRKNAHFFEVFEMYLPRPPKSTSTKVPGPPPPNNPGYMAIDGGAAPWFGGSYLGLQDFS